MESVTLPHQTSLDALGSQGWVSCGRLLVNGPPLHVPKSSSVELSRACPSTGGIFKNSRTIVWG
eukprot:2434575-Pyramimonas_sp.AAC.1